MTQDHSDPDTPTLPFLNLEDSTVLADHDTPTQAEDSTVLADHDTPTQAISEHTTSEEVVTAITTDTEGSETQELTHRGER